MPQTASIDPVVVDRLKELLRSKQRSAYSVAKALGFSSNWLYGVVNGKKGILLPTLRRVATELGVSVGELVDPPAGNGVGPHRSSRQRGYAVSETGTTNDSGDYDPTDRSPVQLLEIASSAGDGTQVYDKTPVGLLWFRNDWLSQHSIDPAQSHIISVQGTSMEPTLQDGCSILVDGKRREPHQGRVYVIRTEEGLVVKRLGLDEKGRWELLSDNPDWKPALMLYGTDIIGEVRWTARTF